MWIAISVPPSFISSVLTFSAIALASAVTSLTQQAVRSHGEIGEREAEQQDVLRDVGLHHNYRVGYVEII
jgi:hypothetical protein